MIAALDIQIFLHRRPTSATTRLSRFLRVSPKDFLDRTMSLARSHSSWSCESLSEAAPILLDRCLIPFSSCQRSLALSLPSLCPLTTCQLNHRLNPHLQYPLLRSLPSPCLASSLSRSARCGSTVVLEVSVKKMYEGDVEEERPRAPFLLAS